MLGLRGFGNALVNDGVQAARDMASKINSMLGRHLADIQPDSPKVADDGGLLVLPPAEQTENPARELRLHSPPERQPQPTVTDMT
jgi:hypothetical protein